MSAILVWLLLLLGAEVLAPVEGATTPADTTTTATTTVTVLDDGSGIPPKSLP